MAQRKSTTRGQSLMDLVRKDQNRGHIRDPHGYTENFSKKGIMWKFAGKEVRHDRRGIKGSD